MRLVGTEEWTSSAVADRISFERNVAEGSLALLGEILFDGDLTEFEDLARIFPTDSIFALGRAAELAFATDNFLLGHKVCEEILVAGNVSRKTPMQLAFYATVGALLQQLSVTLNPFGALISRRHHQSIEKSDIRFDWPLESSLQTAELIKLFLPIAAASLPFEARIDALFENPEGGGKPSVLAVISASPEYQIVSHWLDTGDHAGETARRCLALLEASYSAHISVLRSDAYYWQTLRPRGQIIDWSLLALWVAIYRNQVKRKLLREFSAATPEATFIRQLAARIADTAAE